MKTCLHIITRPLTEEEASLIELEKTTASVQTVTLCQGEVDYPALVEQVFEADAVRVW